MTDNHDYATPQQGTTDWHVPLNDNFDRIDTDVEIRDADANRSDYEPKDGAKFLAVDTRRVYLGDGDEWVHFTTMGGFDGRVYVQPSEPEGQEGDLWVDTSAAGGE